MAIVMYLNHSKCVLINLNRWILRLCQYCIVLLCPRVCFIMFCICLYCFLNILVLYTAFVCLLVCLSTSLFCFVICQCVICQLVSYLVCQFVCCQIQLLLPFSCRITKDIFSKGCCPHSIKQLCFDFRYHVEETCVHRRSVFPLKIPKQNCRVQERLSTLLSCDEGARPGLFEPAEVRDVSNCFDGQRQ